MRRKSLLGFTLIELLIVISIIAILAAMLLPALSRAKKVTYKSSCMSKLKQIGTASFSYADDFNGQFPDYWYCLGREGYLPYGNNYTISTSAGDDAIRAFKKRLAILHCPEDTVFGYISGTWWYCTSYAQNHYLSQDPEAPRISRVKNPSGIIWVIDSTFKKFSFATSFCPLTLEGNRHFNGWNALFVDGHVDWGTSSKFKIGPGGTNIYPVQ